MRLGSNNILIGEKHGHHGEPRMAQTSFVVENDSGGTTRTSGDECLEYLWRTKQTTFGCGKNFQTRVQIVQYKGMKLQPVK